MNRPEHEFRQRFAERTSALVIAAFSFVAGLAWNDAVKAFIDYFFPLQTDTIFAKFVYALLITAVAAAITIPLIRKK